MFAAFLLFCLGLLLGGAFAAKFKMLCDSGRPIPVETLAIGKAYHARHVENQGNPTIAHDGGAGEYRDISKEPSERLNHGLMAAHHPVNHQSHALVFVTNEYDLRDGRRNAAHLKRFAEIDIGNQLAANGNDVAAVIAGALTLRKFDVFGDCRHRDDVLAFARFDEKTLNDGESERKRGLPYRVR
jgi:hypothetical protein